MESTAGHKAPVNLCPYFPALWPLDRKIFPNPQGRKPFFSLKNPIFPDFRRVFGRGGLEPENGLGYTFGP
jgi:hypothetical protein